MIAFARPALLARRRCSSLAPAVAQSARPRCRCSSICAAVETMTADFTQTDRNGKVLTGTLTLKKPGQDPLPV